MTEFKSVELEDRDVIQKYLSQQYNIGCEMTFPSLYIWHKAYNTKFAVVEDCLVLMTKDGDNPAGLRFPVGKGDKLKAAEIACDYMVSIGEKPQFYGVTKEDVDFIKANTDKYEIVDMSKYADYVYESEKLINLSGKKLHSKKNHLNRFKKLYNYEYIEINPSHEDEVMNAYDSWGDVEGKYLQAEHDAIRDVIHNMDYLGTKGAMLKVDGQIVAFSLGDVLNSDTAVIHVEKADTSYEGAYAAINQMFVQNKWSEYKYINREDDCGLEGLKKAKMSYRPVFMVDKYKVIRR